MREPISGEGTGHGELYVHSIQSETLSFRVRGEDSSRRCDWTRSINMADLQVRLLTQNRQKFNAESLNPHAYLVLVLMGTPYLLSRIFSHIRYILPQAMNPEPPTPQFKKPNSHRLYTPQPCRPRKKHSLGILEKKMETTIVYWGLYWG